MYMSKHGEIKIANIRYHVNKNLIKQDQSLKNDYNEHLASKCSFRHARRSNHLWSLACPITRPNAKYKKYMHLGTRSYLGTSVKYLRHIGNILKVPKKKKMLQSIEKVTNIEYKQKLKNRVYYIEVMNKSSKSISINQQL